jgi:hypothetical protein
LRLDGNVPIRARTAASGSAAGAAACCS